MHRSLKALQGCSLVRGCTAVKTEQSRWLAYCRSHSCLLVCLCLCSPNEKQGSFLKSWLDSHLSASEAIGKPLLFEEFGKKLDNGASAEDIHKLRDPVYEASYQAVESAVEANRPLLGSLYWKWAVPGIEKGECTQRGGLWKGQSLGL